MVVANESLKCCFSGLHRSTTLVEVFLLPGTLQIMTEWNGAAAGPSLRGRMSIVLISRRLGEYPFSWLSDDVITVCKT